MSGLLSVIFIGACVGIWYFIKKKPDKNKRNISIGLAVVCFALIGVIGNAGGDEKGNATPDKAATEKKETTKESTKATEVTLEIPSEVEADKDSKATIAGKTTPGARVSVGFGIVGDSVEADNNGDFSLTHDLTNNKEEELTINASKDSKSASAKVTVKPNAEVLAAQEAANKAAQEAAQEAAAKAEAEKNDPATYNTGVTYDNLARTPDQFKGHKVTFQGKIVQVMEGDDYTQYRMAVNSNYDTMALIEITSDKLSTRVLENDIITIYGESVGTISYDSTLGGKITVPAITVNIFNIDGQG